MALNIADAPTKSYDYDYEYEYASDNPTYRQNIKDIAEVYGMSEEEVDASIRAVAGE